MSLVNQFLSQTYERCRRQPPSIQVTACVTVAAVLILIASVTGWQRAHSHEPLFPSRDLNDLQLTTMEAAFGKAGLSDYYTSEGKIFVPRQQRAKFAEAVLEAKVVATRLDEQYQQELSNSSLLESQRQWQARVKMGKERWIAECLCAMPEIDEASVHYDEVELGGLRRERLVRAMVAIKPSVAGTMTAARIQGIRELVAASKALLDPENVTITDLRTGISYAGNLQQTASQLRSDEFIRRKNRYEHEWREKVRAAVSFIPGAEVITNVHLPQPSPLSAAAADTDVPTAVSVSVGIPHSYYHRVRQTQGPQVPEATPDSAIMQRIEQETIQQVQQIVAGLFPPATDQFHAQVVVATFTDLTPASREWQALGFWIQRLRLNPTLLGSVLGLAAMAVWLVRSLWQDAASRHEPPTLAMPEKDEAHCHEACSTSDQPPDENLVESNESVHRELTRLVREDPETAAEMLGEWVRKAG